MKRDPEMEERLRPIAEACFTIAIRTGRAGELMNALFSGASCTIDMATRDLVIVPAEMIQELVDG